MKDKRLIRRSLKWLWIASKGVRGRLAFNCFLGIFRVVASLAFIYLSKILIDMATAEAQRSQFNTLFDFTPRAPMWVYAVCLVVLMALQIGSGLLGNYLSNQTQIRMKNSLQHNLFEHLIRARWSGMESFHSGDILNRLEEDCRLITTTLCSSVPNLIVALINLIAAFVFLCTMNSTLAWVVVCIMPFFLILSKIYITKVRAITKEIRSYDSKIQSTIQESLQNRVLIQSLEKEDLVGGNLSSSQDELYNQTMRRTRFSVFSRTMINIGFAGGYVAVFIYSVWQIKYGIITFGTMTAFLQLVGQIQRPTLDLTRQIPELVQCSTAIDRLKELQDLPVDEDKTEIRLKGAVGVKLSDVWFRYPQGKRDILRNFSCDFAPGSRSAIMGETGSGKSTMVRLMLALLEPQSGEIQMYNSDQNVHVSSSTRCNIAYVPQGNSLLSGTIRDNLRLGNPSATEEELREALHTAAADFVFDLPDGLETSTHEGGAGLSEGQAQRIAIARGLLRPGSIMIMDEFSSSLDSETEKILIQRLIESYKDKTMIFVTHRDRIVRYCSNVVRLERFIEEDA